MSTDPGDLITSSQQESLPVAVSTNAVKTQVLPLVYIQTQSKIPIAPITKASMVGSVPQLQFATLPSINKTTTNRAITNQGVILTPKGQQLVITKPNNMQTVTLNSAPKLGGTYVTMIKPKGDQKLVIAPMPKVIKNRLPVTVTTNTLQPKIAFMPLISQNRDAAKNVYNIKISDDGIETSELQCDEVIDLDSPTKSEKEYELSITEESNNSKNEINAMPKFVKHGVSILKKSTQGDNKMRSNNSIIEPETIKMQKTERRRKSNFSYRKDYDDVEIMVSDVTLTKLAENETVEKIEKKEDFLEIELVKEKKTDINMNDNFDIHKVLNWEEGIGSLPGSNLKFIVNEFGLIEYITKEEQDKMVEKKLVKPVKSKNEFQEELHCQECGCYGLPSEFINTKYCSLDCQMKWNAKNVTKEFNKYKKRKRKTNYILKKSDSSEQPPPPPPAPTPASPTDDEDTSNDTNQDKYSYPWNCNKKGFSWTKYLDHIKAKAAPVKLFKDAFPYSRNGFRVGMKLEGVDPQHPSYFCVLTVAECCGYRLRLHFDGYPDNYDFWVNADSMGIFPAGWCEKYGHVLQAPPGWTIENFNWVTYLRQTKATAAPKHLFVNRAGSAICPNGFRVGMKLEAVDKKNTSLVCVASVRDMMDNRILVHFDSWDDIYDYWADPTSPYIHPVGWCDQYGHNLTPPNDYANPELFTWESYLKETKSVAAPVRAFKQRPACGFKKGMRLECVDKRAPQLIRVATVNDVKDHRIRIHFDGWPDRYSYWVDDDSEDVHPVGWCQKTGHPIETPLTPDDVFDSFDCPTIGCRGIGHIQGPKFQTHSEPKYCPYAEDNIDLERILPDRLLSPDSQIEAVVPISREPREKIKPRIGRPPKYPRLDAEVVSKEPDVGEPQQKPKRKYRKRLKPNDDEEEEVTPPEKIIKIETIIDDSELEPASKESWSRHSQFLMEYVDNCDDLNAWSVNKVANFVSSLPFGENKGEEFRDLEIDGEAFLSLNQKDLVDFFNVKVGPAIKLYNVIVLLRSQVKT